MLRCSISVSGLMYVELVGRTYGDRSPVQIMPSDPSVTEGGVRRYRHQPDLCLLGGRCRGRLDPEPVAVFAGLSMIFWAATLIVCIRPVDSS